MTDNDTRKELISMKLISKDRERPVETTECKRCGRPFDRIKGYTNDTLCGWSTCRDDAEQETFRPKKAEAKKISKAVANVLN